MVDGRTGGITIATYRGIPLRLHWTFLLVLPLFGYLMARAYFAPVPGDVPSRAGWVWGGALAVFLFASVAVHEMAHSTVALRYGIKIRHITLLPIGGVSAMEEMPREPREEFLVSVAGPLTNFVIGIPLFLIHLSGVVPASVPLLPRFVFWAGVLNLFLGGFNLFVPAFPMDGGRILRAGLASRMGRAKATSVAASVGRGLAFLFGVWGFLNFGAGGWLLLLIAFFVWTGATQEERQTRVTETLGNLRVSDVMTADVDVIPVTFTVARVFDAMAGTKHVTLPVVANGHVEGVVHLQDLAKVPRGEHEFIPVGDVATKEYRTLPPEADATEALRLVTQEGAPEVLVMRETHLEGIVTQTDLLRTFQILSAEQGAPG